MEHLSTVLRDKLKDGKIKEERAKAKAEKEDDDQERQNIIQRPRKTP